MTSRHSSVVGRRDGAQLSLQLLEWHSGPCTQPAPGLARGDSRQATQCRPAEPSTSMSHLPSGRELHALHPDRPGLHEAKLHTTPGLLNLQSYTIVPPEIRLDYSSFIRQQAFTCLFSRPRGPEQPGQQRATSRQSMYAPTPPQQPSAASLISPVHPQHPEGRGSRGREAADGLQYREEASPPPHMRRCCKGCCVTWSYVC